MLGIGLGGFMDGFQKGRKMQDEQEDRERRKVLEGRQDAEYERAKGQRDALDKINQEAQSTFKSEVDAGRQKPDDFESFYSKYAIPQIKQTLLGQGKVDEAEQMEKWSQSQGARKGAKLFSSALMKAQTGDSSGALADVLEMGKTQGYIDHGYEVQGHENIMVDGKLTGYRISMKTPDGKPVVQDVTTADLPKLIATFGNPQAAWESQQAARAAAAKRQQEMEDYATKKSIDKAFGTGDTSLRKNAITSLRKRMSGGLDGSEKKFDDLSPEEQEKLIGQEISLVSGQTGLGGVASPTASPPTASQPGRKVVVDRLTGQPVAPKQQAAPAASGGKPAQPASAQPKPEASAPAGATDEERAASVVKAAESAIANGKDPTEIAVTLMNYGIPESMWPPALLEKYGRSERAIGLGQ